jgi:putative FmdB family regulatory protein
MPTYSYKCKDEDCEERTEVRQTLDERDSLVLCVCGSPMKRTFKGGHIVIRIPNPRSRIGGGAHSRGGSTTY